MLTINSLVYYLVKKGYFSSANFLKFIEEVIILTFKVKYSRLIVVVIDNYSSYISKRVRELIEGAGF